MILELRNQYISSSSEWSTYNVGAEAVKPVTDELTAVVSEFCGQAQTESTKKSRVGRAWVTTVDFITIWWKKRSL